MIANVLSAYYLCGTAPSTLCAPVISSTGCQVGGLPLISEWRLVCWELMSRLGVLSVISQFSDISQSLFVSGPFLLVFLPRCLHVSLSVVVSLSASPCLWVTPLSLSLCTSFSPCLPYSLAFHSLFLSHHLFVLVCLAGPVLAPWLSLFSYSRLSPSAWPSA